MYYFMIYVEERMSFLPKFISHLYIREKPLYTCIVPVLFNFFLRLHALLLVSFDPSHSLKDL